MNNQYWFARGYYDGRSVGTMDDDLLNDGFVGEALDSYKKGYDAGVTDYCNYDMEEVTE